MDSTPDMRFSAPEICPGCDGAGGSVVYRTGTKSPHTRQRFEPCPICKGQCEVPSAKALAYRLGRGMRESRVARGLSVFEMARLLGITARHLCDAEHGRLSLSQTRVVFDLRAKQEANP